MKKREFKTWIALFAAGAVFGLAAASGRLNSSIAISQEKTPTNPKERYPDGTLRTAHRRAEIREGLPCACDYREAI